MSEKYSINALAALAKLDIQDESISNSFDDVINWCERLNRVSSHVNTNRFLANPKLKGLLREDVSTSARPDCVVL